jgi:AraC family transcriptional regulator
VFPRTAVEIQHEHDRAFIANPNTITFYNQGQAYRRNVVSPAGDRCDWFGVDLTLVLDVVRHFDIGIESRPEHPFRFPRSWVSSSTYLAQRKLFEGIASGAIHDVLAIEETIVRLLARVIHTSYRSMAANPSELTARRQREVIHHVEFLFSQKWNEVVSLSHLAAETGVSAFHLCRLFRRSTGSTLHQYHQRLRVRTSLEYVIDSSRSLIDIALDAGFSSHSHYTSSFRREFLQTPSCVRGKGISQNVLE